MPTLMFSLLRVFLVLGGLVFAASLAIALTLMLALWGLRAAWAKLTGRPVTPFIIQIDPRGGFERMVRRADRGGATRRRGEGVRLRPEVADVTDVEPRTPSS
jgi:hypothetical protein